MDYYKPINDGLANLPGEAMKYVMSALSAMKEDNLLAASDKDDSCLM